jgi:putative oxidoreductase
MFSNSLANFLAWIYQVTIKVGENLQSIFLLLMRLTWGAQFLIAGLGKFADLTKVADIFSNLAIPFPFFSAFLVAFFEMVGGAFLIVGLASRLICLPLMVIMFIAYSTAHSHVFKDFSFIANPSLLVNEAPFPFLLTVLIVFIFGPGRVSIDAIIKRKLNERF